MGQWNTLHIIDEERLRKAVIPAMKNDAQFIERYVHQYERILFRAPSKKLKLALVDSIMEISNQLSADFKIHPALNKLHDNDALREKYFSIDFENFRILFHRMVFSECALAFPYFKLGYRLMISYLSYIHENTKAEKLIDSIRYYYPKGMIFPGESGIRNWVDAKVVAELNNHLAEIIPNQNPPEYSNHNKFAIIYTNEFKTFINFTKENNFGLISCLDPSLSELKQLKPIGKDLKWESLNIKENLLFK